MTAALVALLASLSLAAWSIEVRLARGWRGLAWLHGFHWAALPVCLFVALALLVSARRFRPPRARAIGFVAAAWAVALASFWLARFALYEAASIWVGLAGVFWTHVWLPLAAAFVLAIVGLHLCARLVVPRLSRWHLALSTVALALVVPASTLAIRLLPAPGGDTDFIHAVKMGYPTFWVTLLLPLALSASSRR